MMHASESVVRRKAGGAYSSSSNPSGLETVNSRSDLRSLPQKDRDYNNDSSQDSSTLVSSEPEFTYSDVLMMGLLPPVAIMLAFGGRPSLLVICFGSVVTYIFDLLGAIEATLVVIIVTLMAFWGSLIYAARYILQSSFLFNIPLIMAFAVVLFWVFILLSSSFRSVRNEFDSHLMYAEAWMFTTMPLVCTAIVTWCICVEIPSMEFPICFSLVYGAYLSLLTAPRKSKLSSNLARNNGWNYIISEKNLLSLYILPCVLSPLLFLIVHRNVIMNFRPRIQALLLSIAVPFVVMISVAERQLEYWPLEKHNSISMMLELWKLGMVFVGAFSVKDHHFFDDIKVFASNNLLPDALHTPILLMTFFLAFTATYQYRNVRKASKFDVEESVYGRMSGGSEPSSVLFNHPMLSFCVVASSLGVGLLTGVALPILPLFVGGCIALSEYYMSTSMGLMHGRELLGISLVVIGVFPIVIVSKSFTDITLRFLTYEFAGSVTGVVTMQDFCTYCSLLTVAAVVLPAMLAGGGSSGKDATRLGHLPGARGTATSLFWSSAAALVFSIGSVLFFAIASFVELLVREQDWSDVSPNVEFVYPSWLFILTTVSAIVASYHAHTLGVMDLTAFMCIVVIELCKGTQLLGFNSRDILTAEALLIVLLFPFFMKASRTTDISADIAVPSVDSVSDVIQLLLYILMSIWPLLLARETILYKILTQGLGHEPTELQSRAACLFIFSGFVTCGLLVFWRKAAFIRSVFTIVAVLSLLVASEALGPVNIMIDASSPTYFVVSVDPLLADQHAGLFLIVSVLLLLGAGVGILPLRRVLPRYIFIAIFTYCGSITLHAWAFPEYLGDLAADVGLFQLPKLLCDVYVFLGTFIVVHCTINVKLTTSSTSLVGVAFFAITLVPFLAVLWCAMDGSVIRHVVGIGYATALSYAIVAMAIRTSELMEETSGDMHKSKVSRDGSSSIGVLRTVITVTSAVLALIWGTFDCVANTSIDADFAVPLVTLVLLAVKRGMFLEKAHPIMASALVTSMWWFFSAFYHIFIRGVAEGKFNVDGYDTRQTVFLPDADVSIWTAVPPWFAYIHILLLLLPIPVILMSSVLTYKNDAEDTVFALAVVSLLSAVAAQIWSIRFLGILGLVMGMWRCSFIGHAQKLSDRMI